MNRFVVGSSAFRGLNVTQISDPGLRMVGIRTSHEDSETVCASSTQQMSMPSVDFTDCSFLSKPLKMNREPVSLWRISDSKKEKRPDMPRRSAVSLKI